MHLNREWTEFLYLRKSFPMKNSKAIIACLLLIASASFGQKLKGSKNVTTEQREVADFDNIEIEDNVELFLSAGDRNEIEIDADDNLHDAISLTVSGGTLRIGATTEVSSFKKFSVKVTYTKLKMVIAKEDTKVTALTDIKEDDFTFKIMGSAKIYCNIKAKNFTLMGNDKAKAELNVTADNTVVELSKNSHFKALIATPKLKCDLYQKAVADIEGDAIDLTLRLDNNSTFVGKNLTSKTALVIAEGSSESSLNPTNSVVIEASGKSLIELYGDQKIELRKFQDSAALRKKQLK